MKIFIVVAALVLPLSSGYVMLSQRDKAHCQNAIYMLGLGDYTTEQKRAYLRNPPEPLRKCTDLFSLLLEDQ